MSFPMLHNFQKDFAQFKDWGLWGFWTEGENCWMVTHLNYYVRSRLMWNAHEDVRALARDYCEKFYGRGADEVERYIWTMEKAVNDAPIHVTFNRLVPWRIIYTPRVMRQLDRQIALAERLTANTPESSHARVIGLVHEYIHAHLAMEQAAADGDFSGSIRHTDEMLRIRSDLGAINPALVPVTPGWANKSDGALEWYKKTYQGLAERVDGTKGNLVAMTPRRWEFCKDPERLGTFHQWYLPGAKGSWEKLDSTLYWEAQGLQDKNGRGYAGQAWYRSSVNVPIAAKEKPLKLTVAGIYGNEMWLWINGRLAEHRTRMNSRNPLDIDVTSFVRAGETNHIALLVETLTWDRNARGGLHRRVFLWSPKGE
jgi:hypothetical protein